MKKKMKFLKLIPILFIFFGNVSYKNEVHAEIKNPEDFRVLSDESKKPVSYTHLTLPTIPQV